MTSDQVLEKLKQILIEDLDLNLSYEDLDETVPLFEGGLALDSVVVVELISFVEQRFKIELPEEMLKMDAFKDLQSVVQVIQEQLPLRQSA
jgi:acyl carrier protein